MFSFSPSCSSSSGWGNGDPHFITLDNKNYTFNGLGEYVMLDANNSLFQVQVRTQLAPGDVKATVFSAGAAQEVNSSKVEVRLADGGEWTRHNVQYPIRNIEFGVAYMRAIQLHWGYVFLSFQEGWKSWSMAASMKGTTIWRTRASRRVLASECWFLNKAASRLLFHREPVWSSANWRACWVSW